MHNNNRSTLSSTVRSLLIAGGLITASLAFSTGVSAADLTINQSLPDSAILSKGPGGESAVSAKTLSLSETELQQIRDGGYTAAIAMHYAGNDWSQAQINGLKAAFDRMGIDVVAVTDAQFKSEKQAADIETLLARHPDVIVSIPVDAVSTAHAFKRAAEARRQAGVHG
jgi:ribose transport system substrate-binding protein